VVTTTPRNVAVLKAILKAPSTVVTHAPTQANRAYLAASFLAEVEARFGGSRLGSQEIEGRLVEDAENALWTTGMLDGVRGDPGGPFDRVVVAVDPSVSGRGDACGIVVVGAVTRGPVTDWRAVVLADETVEAASPQVWAQAAIAAMDRYGGTRLVAEGNQGGRLVEDVIRSVDPLVPLRTVHAVQGKAARALPVAALYEQGRVRHAPGLARLEEQMCLMTQKGWQGTGSPDRLDALVWALTDLMVEPSRRMRDPHVRAIG
jgi:phage terminase large subunit-like protein